MPPHPAWIPFAISSALHDAGGGGAAAQGALPMRGGRQRGKREPRREPRALPVDYQVLGPHTSHTGMSLSLSLLWYLCKGGQPQRLLLLRTLHVLHTRHTTSTRVPAHRTHVARARSDGGAGAIISTSLRITIYLSYFRCHRYVRIRPARPSPHRHTHTAARVAARARSGGGAGASISISLRSLYQRYIRCHRCQISKRVAACHARARAWRAA
jgi:hypothetical protein